MKHAYLIIAHNEPIVLQYLISQIDDERNDIYVHIDKKSTFDVKDFFTIYSKLYILPQRIDARWGDISLIEVEYLLFETAYFNGTYVYYHLISGVDIPIKSQDYIHEFCQLNKGKEFIGFVPDEYAIGELRIKMGIYHLFPRHFKSKSCIIKVCRLVAKHLQLRLNIRRNRNIIFKKGCQWCSITQQFVGYLLKNKETILSLYKYTYCPDEIFITTACWNSPFKDNVYDIKNGYISCKRYIHWVNGELQPIKESDFLHVLSSDSWFARKFTENDLAIVKKIKEYFFLQHDEV